MVQTRGVTLKLKQSEKDNDSDGTLQDDGAIEQVQQFTGDESDDFETPPPTKKHRRKRAGTKKTCQGEPFNPARLNLDVLWHVCSFSTPMDVLNLARTCKYFRWFLMSKSSMSVWKMVLHEVEGLPDCPADLTEPEYTNLVFNPRCHGCGKYTPAIFWRIRRRYCPECRHEQLLYIHSIPHYIYSVMWYVAEDMSLSKGKRDMRCDKDQVNSWIKEYEQCSDKEIFLADMRRHNSDIRNHADDCVEWHKLIASNRKSELRVRRQERANSIIERLEQLGYKCEIDYYGPDYFWRSHKLTSKLLTDEEWTRILPDWLATMDKSRQLRLENTIFRSRRLKLEPEYRRYIAHCSLDTPSFHLLPHAARLARFPPFQGIVEAPEETILDDNNPFASAFAQLPPLVDEWRKQVEADLARLVKIPRLASGDATCDNTDVASNQTNQTDSDKLQLACALFSAGYRGIFTHPEVLLVCVVQDHAWRPDGSINWSQIGIFFVDEAPYIIRACGLDPNVATVDDMDRRNARLKCLCCNSNTSNPFVMNWRTAITHAHSRHRSSQVLAPLSEAVRWQLVDDEWVDKIQAAEFVDFNPALSFVFMRCLLCSPCVGTAMYDTDMRVHLNTYHEVNSEEAELGVHYALLTGIKDPYSTYVEMVEERGEVTFRKIT